MFERLIAYQAGVRPDALAVTMIGQSYSYGQMRDDVRRVANVLAATTPIAAGQRVGLYFAHPYLHWLATLALESMGAVSVGAPHLDPELVRYLACDFLILEEARPVEPAPPHLIVDQDWIARMRASTPTPRRARARAAGDPIRIVATSGTTGQMRKILLTRDMLDRRLMQAMAAQLHFGAQTRGLCQLPATSIGGLMSGLIAFMSGAALCHHNPAAGWAATLTELDVQTIVLAPFHLQMMLAQLPADFPRRPGLALFVAGGSLTKPLAAEARARLTDNIISTYGSTEAGGAMGHLDLMQGAEDSAGYVVPWSDIEALDEDGRVLPPGRPGELRMRSSGMAEGYLDDPEATALNFKDGWFYPRDIGVVSDAGLLTVLGRSDDLMHFGGAKFLPSQIEGWALAVDGVADAAAFSVPDAHGLETPWLAYVAEAGLDAAALQDELDRQVERPVRLLPLAAIPRNPMGKIERVKLRAQAAG